MLRCRAKPPGKREESPRSGKDGWRGLQQMPTACDPCLLRRGAWLANCEATASPPPQSGTFWTQRCAGLVCAAGGGTRRRGRHLVLCVREANLAEVNDLVGLVGHHAECRCCRGAQGRGATGGRVRCRGASERGGDGAVHRESRRRADRRRDRQEQHRANHPADARRSMQARPIRP